ncbi:MAG: hypothetical protein WC333_01535 [Dehalococcoidia bacterium]|jgi:hypothetical protein
MKKDNRQRLFEVMERVDPTFNIPSDMDEKFQFFAADPKKRSKKMADELLNNPMLIDRYRFHLDNFEGEDIANILVRYPLLISFFKPFLNKLNPMQTQAVQNVQDKYYIKEGKKKKDMLE